MQVNSDQEIFVLSVLLEKKLFRFFDRLLTLFNEPKDAINLNFSSNAIEDVIHSLVTFSYSILGFGIP